MNILDWGLKKTKEKIAKDLKRDEEEYKNRKNNIEKRYFKNKDAFIFRHIKCQSKLKIMPIGFGIISGSILVAVIQNCLNLLGSAMGQVVLEGKEKFILEGALILIIAVLGSFAAIIIAYLKCVKDEHIEMQLEEEFLQSIKQEENKAV